VNQDYVDAVAAAGGAPICIPIDLPLAALHSIYSTLDGLLLPGGDDVAPHRYGQDPHPNLGIVDDRRDELELTMATWALRDDLPIHGICRGVQLLAVAGGGTLYQDVPSQFESRTGHDVREFGRDYTCHDVDITPATHLAAATGCTRLDVNSFHHQAVLDVPPGFVVNARACDGIIEGIEAPEKRFVVGVQCHPEAMWRTTVPEFAGLFRAFVDAAAERAGRRAA
jgi:putative glutamine amidotransferase